jgi:flavin-dependent dehydrogenase
MAPISAVQIVGAGPAGAAAAIAALQEPVQVQVEIIDRSRTARHKVCGEFISPEASSVLEQLGVWEQFLKLGPSRIRRCELHFGSRVKQWTLAEPAFGLSRLALDSMLIEHARSKGAVISRGIDVRSGAGDHGPALVVASGRHPGAVARPRLFGFKAHFEGPLRDAVELFFGHSGYVGINPVEHSLTNVCGIAPEDVLRRYGFEIDAFIQGHSHPLTSRLEPLSRRMPWLTTGPLTFALPCPVTAPSYVAGDALGFIDPFTGSGILHALLTGHLAGVAASRRLPPAEYLQSCRNLLRRPAAMSAVIRAVLRTGLAGIAARLVPGDWMYQLTRAAGLRHPP